MLRNVAPRGETTVLLDANNQAGLAELKVLAGGGCQLNALDQTSGPANLLIEANTGSGSDGELIAFRGVRRPTRPSMPYYDRVEGPANQVGFVAQQVEASGPLGKSLCKLKKFGSS